MLLTLIYFIVALLLLVLVHEYGHFIVARCCGVKVLRFSFGFGKVLARWRGKHGTEYAWSLFPLGGYVKMLDESEGEVAEDERHLAFNNKPLWARVAIVLAGPLFNFLFAFAALWLVLILGVYSLAPMIDRVKAGSPAALAGLQANEEILSLNDKPIHSWRDFQYAMLSYVGSDDSLKLLVKSRNDKRVQQRQLSLANWKLDAKKPDVLDSLGITPFIPTVPPIVGTVMADSPAMAAGIQVNDRIVQLNGEAVTDWMTVVNYVQQHPDTRLNLIIVRNNQRQTVVVTSGKKDVNGQQQGFLGLMSKKPDWPDAWLRYDHESAWPAAKTALAQMVNLSGATFALLGRFATGRLALDNLSGPVGIAQGAGDSGRGGLASYLSFLAIVSISLGVLNLLPIPMLDGGHLLYYLIEFVRRKPLSDASKTLGMYLGLFFLLALMVLALRNDLYRLLG